MIMADRIPIARALLSVSDKTGLGDLGKALAAAGVQIVASGGTSRTLEEHGIKARQRLQGFRPSNVQCCDRC